MQSVLILSARTRNSPSYCAGRKSSTEQGIQYIRVNGRFMLKTEIDVQIMISNTRPGGTARAFGLGIEARGNGLAQACPAATP